MNTLEVVLTLRYDDAGNVVSYELSPLLIAEPDVMIVTSLGDPPSPHINTNRIVAERLIGAINTEFKLPPIPGMSR